MTPTFAGLESISGRTRVAAVIGDPIARSLSPRIHNAAFAATGLDWVYVAATVGVGHGEAAVRAAAALGFGGLSVTMPCKHEAAAACDELTPLATTLGAVNCVTFRDGRILGDSTDGAGLIRALRDEGADPRDASVLLLGAGGAATAVAYALLDAGAAVTVAARRPDAVSAPVDAVVPFAEVATVAAGAAIVINATPVGMDGESMPFDPDAVRADALVIDTITQPVQTPWVAALRTRGVHAVNGVGMLIGQGAVAFEHWTGVAAPIEAMREAVQTPHQ